MADFVLPSKLVDERITVRFDFMSSVEWGEAIEGAECEVSVFAGLDPEPEEMLFSSVSISGLRVSQQIYAGLPGVIYLVKCTVVGSTGNRYEQVGKLAVLPSSALLPPFIATYYTSPPYPVNVLEELTLGGSIEGGMLLTENRDYIWFETAILGGTLRGTLIEYSMQPEGLDVAASLVSGTLYEPLVQYDYMEALAHTSVIMSGTLDQIIIVYSYGPEGLDCETTILSGTLT